MAPECLGHCTVDTKTTRRSRPPWSSVYDGARGDGGDDGDVGGGGGCVDRVW